MTSLIDFQPIHEVIVVGDLHGKINSANFYARHHHRTLHIAIGDIGVGFGEPVNLDKNIRFFRGNHDDPMLCQTHPAYLGDFGYIQCYDKLIYYIGGGYSTDQAMRIPFRDWWPDEELSVMQFDQIITDVQKYQPDIILSHECPASIMPYLHKYCFQPSRTAQALDSVLYYHKPQTWIFGHHHMPWSEMINGTHFMCLEELEQITLEV